MRGGHSKYPVETPQRSPITSLLAALDWRDVEVLAVATTHTVTAMNCVNGGTRGLDDNLSIDGRLNKDKIVQQFPSMAKPLEEGFE